MRTLPELLRLVPGVQVAQLTSSNWAISIRGFNDQFSNKLLVLIDGRSTYTRAFSGTFWDGEDLFIDDIDRIEVIRGPGASVWGANAVNGVINVVTKTAKDSRGLLVRLGRGGFDRGHASARYGGSLKGADYRVYSQWTPGATLSSRLAHAITGSVPTGERMTGRGHQRWTIDAASGRAGDGRCETAVDAVPICTPHRRRSSFRTGTVLARCTRRTRRIALMCNRRDDRARTDIANLSENISTPTSISP